MLSPLIRAFSLHTNHVALIASSQVDLKQAPSCIWVLGIAAPAGGKWTELWYRLSFSTVPRVWTLALFLALLKVRVGVFYGRMDGDGALETRRQVLCFCFYDESYPKGSISHV